MRIYYIICSVISSISNVLLLVLFRSLRPRLEGIAWLCIIAAFSLVLMNNLIISFIVIERPSPETILILLIVFFALKPVKNVLWLTGFWSQHKNFIKMENIEKELAKYISSDTHKAIGKDVSVSLMEDLYLQNKDNEQSAAQTLVDDLKKNEREVRSDGEKINNKGETNE